MNKLAQIGLITKAPILNKCRSLNTSILNYYLLFMLNLFEENDIYLTAVLHCPHVDGQCDCRKPKPRLFYYAATHYDIDFRKSFAVGNELRDLCICAYEPVTGILISETKKPIEESSGSFIRINDFYSACQFIADHHEDTPWP